MTKIKLFPHKPTQRKCPICNGSGKIPVPLYQRRYENLVSKNAKAKGRPKNRKSHQNAIMAKLLRKEGYSYAEIARFLGYKSKRSVQLCLQRET